MEQKLRSLYKLELLDTELDELRELRGDLPDAVNKLEEELEGLQEKIDKFDTYLKDGAADRARKERESLELIDKIEKYKAQQLDVKNNKEYDALTHQIEMAENTISAYEQEMELYVEDAAETKDKKAEVEKERDELIELLNDKKSELDDIMGTTREEEEQRQKEREDALKSLTKEDLELYNHIREAKQTAVSPIKRESCSGCYNIVPPQLILEVKKNDTIYRCEHCGRILVSEEIATEINID